MVTNLASSSDIGSVAQILDMAALVQNHDWTVTALGAVKSWPQSLRTAVDIMLGSGHAMCIAWGRDRTFLYNDAYIPMLGERHPDALGQTFEKVWPDVWNDIEPLVDQTFRGETCTFKDLPLLMTRNGYPEETWWTFSYSPIRNEAGEVEGLLNVTLETTDRVQAERDRDIAAASQRDSESRLRALVNASSDSVYSMSPDWSEMRHLDGRGFIPDTDAPTVKWHDSYLFEEDVPTIQAAIDHAIATKGTFELEHRIRRTDGSAGWTSSRAVPILAEDGSISEWFGMAGDVTARHDSEEALRSSEAFMASVLASSTDCIKVLDLEGRLTFMTDGGQRVMEVSDFGAIIGCPWPDFWAGIGNDKAVAAIDAARNGEARSFVGHATTMAGTPKWWHVAVSPIRDANGKPERILSVSRDITNIRESEEERDRFVRLAENSNDFIAMMRLDGRLFYLNNAARQMVGLGEADVSGLTFTDLLPPDQAGIVADEALPAVDRGGHWAGELCLRHSRTDELIPVLNSIFPITDAGGAPIGYGIVTRDFRDRKRAEDDMRMMNGELAHRLKNVLSVVQSIAQQTLRSAGDLQTANQDLSARLVALGAATDVLTNASWRSANLRELAVRALAPHGRIGERILIDGPSVTLKPEVGVALALALHELATNAAKYGALSNDTGIVHLDWTIDDTASDARFSLHWREQGGPPVSRPTRRGFGSALIERSLRAYFGGEAATDYHPQGFVFELKSPLDRAAITSGN
jgi:PAS domain S-box-containing protein